MLIAGKLQSLRSGFSERKYLSGDTYTNHNLQVALSQQQLDPSTPPAPGISPATVALILELKMEGLKKGDKI